MVGTVQYKKCKDSPMIVLVKEDNNIKKIILNINTQYRQYRITSCNKGYLKSPNGNSRQKIPLLLTYCMFVNFVVDTPGR